jgi:hypothetical protein
MKHITLGEEDTRTGDRSSSNCWDCLVRLLLTMVLLEFQVKDRTIILISVAWISVLFIVPFSSSSRIHRLSFDELSKASTALPELTETGSVESGMGRETFRSQAVGRVVLLDVGKSGSSVGRG